MIGAWFALAGPRANLATDQRNQAVTAADPAEAYRLVRTAAALDGSPTNLTTYGAAAFRQGSYDHAADLFQNAATDSREAVLGWLLSAAADQDQSDFDQAVTDLGTARDDTERAVLANALLTAGRFERLRQSTDRPTTSSEAAARAIGVAETDPTRAIRLVQTDPDDLTVTVADPLLKQVIITQTDWPRDSRQKLATTFTAMQRPVSQATRRVLLADRLLELDRPQTGRALADEAVRDQPEYRDGWNTLAAAQYRLGEYDDADRSLAVSLKLDDAFGFTWYLRSQVAARQDRTADATRYADQAKRLGYDK